MKNKRIVSAMSDIDDMLIAEAESDIRKSAKISPVYKWGGIAACFVIALCAAICLPMMLKEDTHMGGWDTVVGDSVIDADSGNKYGVFALDELSGRYKDENVVFSESGSTEWSWDELTLFEKYSNVIFNGKNYSTRGGKIDHTLLGKYLGVCEGYGYEYVLDSSVKHTESFEVYGVDGVSTEAVIAIELDGEYCVYFSRDIEKPATLGEFMDILGFESTVELEKYSLHDGRDDKGYYKIELDDFIMNILAECKDAPAMQDDMVSEIIGDEYAAFTVTSEALGVYKKVMYISSLGYVFTNAMDYGWTYNIGIEAAARIMEYLKGENAIESYAEPYKYYLYGTVTEIGDGYIMLDDSIMCKNADEGIVFRIDTSDKRCQRCVKHIEVGKVVRITFEGQIMVGEDNTVTGAISIEKGQLAGADVIIPE